MARPRNGKSPHTHYRRARENLAALVAEHDKLLRSRPRTPGKKGAKTRALKGLSLRIRAARGMVTKARNAIAKATSQRAASKKEASRKRSEAAKKGWATRRARVSTPQLDVLGLFMPHLTIDGPDYIHPVGNDRSLEGAWWVAAALFLDNKPNRLDDLGGKSVLDTATGRRMPFITDRNVILHYQDSFDFGSSFYKRRNEVRGLAA
jgi:hypothetical protein